MKLPSCRRLLSAFLFGVVACLAAAAAHADPPYRVARLSYASGGVSFSPAGEDEWSRAAINRPLIAGDRLWVDSGSRAELQVDGGALRMGEQTSLTLLNVDDRIVQAQLTQGELELRVWRLDPGQTVEIDTPNLAAVINRPGAYRIDADEKYGSTQVTVRAGDATLYGEGNAFRVTPGQTWEFYDTALTDYDTYAPGPPDDLQRFAMSRDRRWRQSVSARYVSPQMIGFEELDQYGSWRQVPEYGWVWSPLRVAPGWAPYREGHWAWVEPWGWTWVDDAPWGFAPFHYGRWAFVESRWCWVPGPRSAVRPVYAPALVAFIGDGGLSVSIGIAGGAIGWFPLGPREVYRPAYQVSRDYFTRVNVTNTVVSVTQVTNVYQQRNVTNITYVNQRVPGAVIAVPTAAFTQARPVAREAVRVQPQSVANVAPQAVMIAPPVAPARQSVLGPQPAQRRPPEHVFSRQVVAQTPPPPPPAPIESKLPALRSHPGRPVAPGSAPARPAAPAAAAAPAPAVKVVTPETPAAAPPPPRPPAANRPEHERRGPPLAAPAPAQPSPPAAEQRRRDEERGRAQERQRERPPLTAPARPGAVPPPVAAPAPAPAAPPPVAAPTPQPAPPVVRPQEAAPPTPQQRREERREERREAPRPVPAPAPQAAPAARPPEAAPPTPQQRREERRQEREAAPSAAPAPQPRPQPPRPQPAPAPQAAPPEPPPAPSAPRPPNARAEQRREAASEARREREERREERRP